MNYEKIGKFISEKRKEKGLTQKDLATLIGVTDKAVSKWERGLGCPDVSILEILSECLNVSILEILKGRKIENEIIKPKDDLINKLYNENISLHKELSKQANTVNIATEYEKKHTQILEDNVNLKFKCKKLEKTLENKEKELKQQFEDETYKIDYQYQKIINKLEKENNYLKKGIDRFKFTVQKFITWICHKFSAPSEEALIRDFERETYMDFDVEKQLNKITYQKEEQENDYEMGM